MMLKRISILTLLSCLVLLSGCAVEPYDYTALHKSKPRSIVVIPPENNTVDVDASYKFLSTISKPLAEKGYYVFPVSVIDHFLKENGLPTPAEMNNVPLDKILENIGADAVLYITIVDWGQKYQVLSSKAVVHSTLRLVDTRSGALLWDGVAYAENSSGDGGGGLAGALIGAVVQQIIGSMMDQTQALSRSANQRVVFQPQRGLLNGPYVTPEQTVR